ncbi:MAG: cyclopentanol dehydrogenase [Chloroflexi bacterium]|jgi:cyclopentanol dehydrogenase|nr:MAG: cyclopentanol dehydrogenase [Chloroflexota bacterium]
MRLAKKVAIITGGTGNLGIIQARRFALEGASIIIADIDSTKGKQIEHEIQNGFGKAIFVYLDVTNESSWIELVNKTEQLFGLPTILVQNAGIYKSGKILDTDGEQWDSIMNVNAKGVFLGTKSVLPKMIAAGGGSIVNISSTAGIIGSRISTAYNPSKAAVRVFTKSTALQYARNNVRANSIHPGPVESEMLSQVYPDKSLKNQRGLEIPLGRFASATDVCNAALFLASDESSYMTGSELIIDGGLTAQ